MIANEKQVKVVLKKHLGSAVSEEKLGELAKELAALGDQWEEVADVAKVIGANVSIQCEDICAIGELHRHGEKLRVFRKK